MKINNIEIEATQFAYDGCHKIYIIEDEQDKQEAIKLNYKLYHIEELPQTYNNSCSLRFINNWKLDKTFCGQFETAKFE